MRVLVVGGGGREHALVWRLSQNTSIDRIYAAPGNPGVADLAACEAVDPMDADAVLELVERERIDLTVVGPEAPLVAGLADALEARGHRVFGPTAVGARLEGSKAWTKDLCHRHGIPAAQSESFEEVTSAVTYLEVFDPPYVVKVDGLAAGKGVTIAPTREIAVAAIEAALVDRAFGPAGDTVVIEEYLEGREVSALAITDGRTVLPLALAQDFKRVGDRDAGPNTGGMGAYSPVPFVDEVTESRIRTEVLDATVRALDREGVRYRGVLYAGLMVTAEGPKVLEFNCRFGDPETQAILPRLATDLCEPLLAATEGNLDAYRLGWSDEVCVTVILASGGYPGAYETGVPITGLDDAAEVDDVVVFHAGTALEDGRVVTAGGRVLAVSALGKDLAAARERAYEASGRISFEGKNMRTDIALEASRG